MKKMKQKQEYSIINNISENKRLGFHLVYSIFNTIELKSDMLNNCI